MNDLVFKKIREELIKNTERKKIFAKKSTEEKIDAQVLSAHGIEIITNPDLTLPELKAEEKKAEIHPILAQKLSGSFKTPIIETQHSLDNITKKSMPNPVNIKPKIPGVDPYREMPE